MQHFDDIVSNAWTFYNLWHRWRWTDGWTSRSATEYGNGGNLVEMLRQNLIAERIVIEHYQELIRYFGDNDPMTRIMLEHILADEEDHASDA